MNKPQAQWDLDAWVGPDFCRERLRRLYILVAAQRAIYEESTHPEIRALHRGWYHGLAYAFNLMHHGDGKTELEWVLEEDADDRVD